MLARRPDAPMAHANGPLLTAAEADALRAARDAGADAWDGSLDLGRQREQVRLDAQAWHWRGQAYPYPGPLRPRTVYAWDGAEFVPLARYGCALIKLVPTPWGVPTFEIDGIKMLPSARVSPLEDARRKVALVQPAGARVLDTCGGLGYFAACVLAAGAARIDSCEKDPDVLWLRAHNPWSPDPQASGGRLHLQQADVRDVLPGLPEAGYDVVLHDPPRFGIAGELYALEFYRGLARVLRRGGRLFHYVGSPNRLTSGRDVPGEVLRRLERAGFRAERALDGVLAVRR